MVCCQSPLGPGGIVDLARTISGKLLCDVDVGSPEPYGLLLFMANAPAGPNDPRPGDIESMLWVSDYFARVLNR